MNFKRLPHWLGIFGAGIILALATLGGARAGPDVYTVDVLTANVFMPPIVAPDSDGRAARLPAVLRGHDILLLQEAYNDSARRTLLTGLARDYPYRTRVLGRDSGFRQDGGVVIVSRWPIEHEFQLPYAELCAGGDCLADKGVLYARVNKAGQRVHVFATHLQSGSGNGAIREKQLRRLRALIEAMQLPIDEPVLIGGDMNVDRLDRAAGGFDMLKRILDARQPEPPAGDRYRPTFDPALNPLARGGKRAKYLDYILYSEQHRRPFMASNQVQALSDANGPLSDHFAVHGRFVFDAASPAVADVAFPVIELLDGEDPRADFLCGLALPAGETITVGPDRDCGGDTKSAFRLLDIPAGHVIRLYESEDGDHNEDWVEITAKRYIRAREIDGFEQSFEDADLRMRYHAEDGFDGRISRIEVQASPILAERPKPLHVR